MSRVCTICSRKPMTSLSRSHSNVGTKRRQFLNLQTKRISGKRQRICSKCLKSTAIYK